MLQAAAGSFTPAPTQSTQMEHEAAGSQWKAISTASVIGSKFLLRAYKNHNSAPSLPSHIDNPKHILHLQMHHPPPCNGNYPTLSLRSLPHGVPQVNSFQTEGIEQITSQFPNQPSSKNKQLVIFFLKIRPHATLSTPTLPALGICSGHPGTIWAQTHLLFLGCSHMVTWCPQIHLL